MLEYTRAMEQPTQTTAPLGVSSVGQLGYATPTYQPAAVVTGAPAVMGVLPSAQPGSTFPTAAALARHHQLAYQQVQQFHHQQQQHQHRQLQAFWAEQMSEIEQTTDFKNHSLPLARIKKIMKADEDVQMISAEDPVIFAKACEIFILELTLRSWIHTEENKRRTLQKNDIAAAITMSDIFDFLVDIVPRDELKEEGLGIPRAALPAVGGAADSVPYYYVPAQNPAIARGMIMGTNVDHTGSAASAICGGQQPRPMAFMWQSHQAQPPQQSQQHMPDSS